MDKNYLKLTKKIKPLHFFTGLGSVALITASLFMSLKETQTPQKIVTKAATPATTISLQASTVNPTPNQNVDVFVHLQTGVNSVGSARVVLTYPTDKLSFVSAVSGGFFVTPELFTQSSTPGTVTMRFFPVPPASINTGSALAKITLKTASNFSGTASVRLTTGTYVGALDINSAPQNDIMNTLPVTLNLIAPTPTPTVTPTSVPTPTSAPTPTPSVTQISGSVSTLRYDRLGKAVISYPSGISVWAKNNTTSVTTGPVLTEKMYSIYWTDMNRYKINVPSNKSYTLIACLSGRKAVNNIGTVNGSYLAASSFQINMTSPTVTCP